MILPLFWMAKWTWEETEAILDWTKNVSVKNKIPFSAEHCEDCLKCHEKVTSAGQSFCVRTSLVLTVVNICVKVCFKLKARKMRCWSRTPFTHGFVLRKKKNACCDGLKSSSRNSKRNEGKRVEGAERFGCTLTGGECFKSISACRSPRSSHSYKDSFWKLSVFIQFKASLTAFILYYITFQ